MATIQIEIVNTQLTNFENSYSSAKVDVDSIQSNFFDGMEQKWNSETAHSFMTSVANSFAEVVSNFSQAAQSQTNAIIEECRKISSGEGGATVKSVSLSAMPTISVSWPAKSDGYTVSPDIASFTQSKFIIRCHSLESAMEDCRNSLLAIANSGLGPEFSNGIIEAFADTYTKIKEISESVATNMSKNAEIQDANYNAYKM